ncbi:MAG: hypothetical protein V3U41_09015, partial [candidate division NC10 bacterium]
AQGTIRRAIHILSLLNGLLALRFSSKGHEPLDCARDMQAGKAPVRNPFHPSNGLLALRFSSKGHEPLDCARDMQAGKPLTEVSPRVEWWRRRESNPRPRTDP